MPPMPGASRIFKPARSRVETGGGGGVAGMSVGVTSLIACTAGVADVASVAEAVGVAEGAGVADAAGPGVCACVGATVSATAVDDAVGAAVGEAVPTGCSARIRAPFVNGGVAVGTAIGEGVPVGGGCGVDTVAVVLSEDCTGEGEGAAVVMGAAAATRDESSFPKMAIAMKKNARTI